MNLLIIEDELRLSDMLRDYFVGKDHAVTLCGDGRSGLETALSSRYDAIVLDVMLPGMDGFEVLSRLRASDNDTPVLMLTARSSLRDKLAGFESGAEDYLTKPFDIEELEARLCVLTKKRAGAEIAALRFGELLLQRDDHLLHDAKSGLSVALSAKEFTLMSYFMENAGQLLSKEQITVRIWGYDTDVSYNNEEVYISFLRKKLAYLQTDARIETVRGAGYRLRKL